MAGLVRREDIDQVRERARIEDVVGEHVSLRAAGVGSMKGLCPFHDERTPSFHVRPQLGLWHCFGCSEGGDVFSFVQKINHMSFLEAVEYLGAKYGVELRYEDGQAPRRTNNQGQRRRLLEAHRVAEAYYSAQLLTPEGQRARQFLQDRGFSREDVDRFAVGYSPSGWDGLLRTLRAKSFTDDEIVASGLAIRGNRGPYDRFRDRVMWPIRDVTGATVGFGARRLGDDPNQPKYLNTPETPIYHKASVLYGLDLAKKDIARKHKVVVVEGYTDVMAAHAAGETTAVATCGTAFGSEHTSLIRRLLGDTAHPGAGVMLSDGRTRGGEVIFTFDGDEAGRNAARRAYMEDQSFAVQTFVAVDPHGKDPCDLRLEGGDDALRHLIASRVPLFEFVLRSVLSKLDLDTVEGRVQGLRVAAPILAGIRDDALRSEYSRQVAGWLGLEPSEVENAQRAAHRQRKSAGGRPETSAVRTPVRDDKPEVEGGDSPVPAPPLPLLPDGPHGHSFERLALAATLQRPLDTVGAGLETLSGAAFADPRNRAVFTYLSDRGALDPFLDLLQEEEARLGVGEQAASRASRRWVSSLIESAPAQIAEDITALLVMSLPVEEENQRDYAVGMVRSLVRRQLSNRVRELQIRIGRMDPESAEFAEVSRQLWEAEKRRQAYMHADE